MLCLGIYSNVCGKIVAYVVVRDFVFWVREFLCWEIWWLKVGSIMYVKPIRSYVVVAVGRGSGVT